jgi:hypothetical protein
MSAKFQKQQKLRFYLDCSDKKAIVRTALLILFFAAFFFVAKVDIKDFLIRHDPTWTKTVGQIQSVEDITGITHTRVGSRITTIAYKIEYSYMVKGVRYEQIYVSGRENVADFVRFIKPSDKVEIYHKKKNHKKSYINFDIDSDFYRRNR